MQLSIVSAIGSKAVARHILALSVPMAMFVLARALLEAGPVENTVANQALHATIKLLMTASPILWLLLIASGVLSLLNHAFTERAERIWTPAMIVFATALYAVAALSLCAFAYLSLDPMRL